MKINNVEKFREDIIKAIDDCCNWDVDHNATYIVKAGYEDKARMVECNHYESIDKIARCVSLYQPIKLMGTDMYITISTKGATFFEDYGEYFAYKGTCDVDMYQNRLSYVMALAHKIDWVIRHSTTTLA